jgi:hypothetical protein
MELNVGKELATLKRLPVPDLRAKYAVSFRQACVICLALIARVANWVRRLLEPSDRQAARSVSDQTFRPRPTLPLVLSTRHDTGLRCEFCPGRMRPDQSYTPN